MKPRFGAKRKGDAAPKSSDLKDMKDVLSGTKNKLPYIVCIAVMAMQVLNIFAFAGSTAAADQAITIVFNVATYIAMILGVIMLIAGIIKFVVAHTNDSGPDQQKAAQMIAAAIVLIGLGGVLSLSPLKNLVAMWTSQQ